MNAGVFGAKKERKLLTDTVTVNSKRLIQVKLKSEVGNNGLAHASNK